MSCRMKRKARSKKSELLKKKLDSDVEKLQSEIKRLIDDFELEWNLDVISIDVKQHSGVTFERQCKLNIEIP